MTGSSPPLTPNVIQCLVANQFPFPAHAVPFVLNKNAASEVKCWPMVKHDRTPNPHAENAHVEEDSFHVSKRRVRFYRVRNTFRKQLLENVVPFVSDPPKFGRTAVGVCGETSSMMLDPSSNQTRVADARALIH